MQELVVSNVSVLSHLVLRGHEYTFRPVRVSSQSCRAQNCW